jgi:hypothetical protein
VGPPPPHAVSNRHMAARRLTGCFMDFLQPDSTGSSMCLVFGDSFSVVEQFLPLVYMPCHVKRVLHSRKYSAHPQSPVSRFCSPRKSTIHPFQYRQSRSITLPLQRSKSSGTSASKHRVKIMVTCPPEISPLEIAHPAQVDFAAE